MPGADEQQTTPKRVKWVRAESREEHECVRLGWKLITQEKVKNGSLWCLWAEMVARPAHMQKVQSMTKKTTEHSIDEALADALSDYMMDVCGRRPTPSEMWDIYWAAIDAIERAASAQEQRDGP